jgi:mannose-6-phosphate isomerase-like protein (cupin superfamily)
MSAHIPGPQLPGAGTPSVTFEQPALQSGISAFLVDLPMGRGAKAHRHPYAETFFVHSGAVDFVVDGTTIHATAGDIVVAQAGETHQFTSVGDVSLAMTCVHASDKMETEWV